MGWTYHCGKDNHFDCPDSHEDKYECDCPCHLEHEVDPDDYVSEDGNTWYQDGKLLFKMYEDDEDWVTPESKLMDHANAHEYWPNAWIISDHGNLIPFSYKEK